MSSPGLICRFREVAIEQSLRRTTTETYEWWIKKFYNFTGRKPAAQWRGKDLSAFLHQLARDRYSGKSRKQALCAIIFVFKRILQFDPGLLDLPPSPKEQRTVKVIPTREEIGRIFIGLKGQVRLAAAVIYGAGLRVDECCHLRVQDFDFASSTITVHSGKGNKDRLTLLPEALVSSLQRHLAWRTALHDYDLSAGAGLVELPGRLALKYKSAPRELRWQFFFPSTVIRGQYRWHMVPETMQQAIRKAVTAAGIQKRVTSHTLRHAFATHALRAGNDIITIQELLGHECVETTMIYLHGDRARGVSPLDVAPFEVPRRLPDKNPICLPA